MNKNSESYPLFSVFLQVPYSNSSTHSTTYIPNLAISCPIATPISINTMSQ